MVRSFGGYFGLQTAPSMWAGASGIWSIKDISYFQQQAQWPGSGSQFAAVAFTHGPNNIGGAPYLSVYRYFPGSANVAPTGIGSKYPSPQDTVGYRNYGLAFSPDNNTIAAGAGNYNYYNFYRWSDSGFGTRYNSPTDTGNSIIMDIHFNYSSNCVALAVSSFGPTTTIPSTTPSLFVYKWDPTNGFGTKFSDPITVPYIPEIDYLGPGGNGQSNSYPSTARVMIKGIGAVAFNHDSTSIVHANGEHNPSLYVYQFDPTSGFGAQGTAVTKGVGIVGGTYNYSIFNSIQFTADSKCAVIGLAGVNASTGVGNISSTTLSTIAHYNSSTRAFASTSSLVDTGLQVYWPQGVIVQARIGTNVLQVSKGTAAATSNTSNLFQYFHSALGAGSLVSRLRLTNLANTSSSGTIVGGIAPYAVANTVESLYGTGIDATPNGRECVYVIEGGGFQNMYSTINRPLIVATNSVTTLSPGLPSMANKVRFNNFSQDAGP